MSRKKLERLINEETEASETSREDGPADSATRKGQTRSVVYSVRLTEDETAEIQQIADGAGIPASGLVREWVLRGLAAEREAGTVDGLIETLSRDLERLRRRLRRRAAS